MGPTQWDVFRPTPSVRPYADPQGPPQCCPFSETPQGDHLRGPFCDTTKRTTSGAHHHGDSIMGTPSRGHLRGRLKGSHRGPLRDNPAGLPRSHPPDTIGGAPLGDSLQHSQGDTIIGNNSSDPPKGTQTRGLLMGTQIEGPQCAPIKGTPSRGIRRETLSEVALQGPP